MKEKRGRPSIILEIVVVTVLFLAGSAGADPVEEWNRTYGNRVIYDVQQTPDDGYILTAIQTSGLVGAHLIKTEGRGNEVWDRELGEDIIVYALEQTADGGYMLVGSKSIYGDYGSKDFAVAIKTDASGNEEWNRSFNENIDEFDLVRGGFNSVQQTTDSGYILAETASRDGSYYARVIKIDPGGNTEWCRQFQKSYQALVLQTPDRGYLFATARENSTSKDYDAMLIKLDADGNHQWNRTFSGKNGYYISSMVLTDDGYALAGSLYSSGRSDAWLIKTDGNGNDLWVKTFGGTNDDGFRSIQKTADGGYILTGQIGADYSNDVLPYLMGDGWVIKVDANGNTQWDMIFGELDMISVMTSRQTHDGGYIMAGRSDGSWLMKLGNETTSAVQPEKKNDEIQQMWTRTYDPGNEIYAVQQTKDTGFIIAGLNSPDIGQYYAWFMKTDASGNTQWNKFFAGEQFLIVKESSSGGYIFGGSSLPRTGEKLDALLLKTDSYGEEQWKKTFSDKNRSTGISAILAVNEGYLIPINVNGQETRLLKTDLNGNELWMKNFTGATAEIQETEDGGYILAGSEYGSGKSFIGNGWLIKTDEYGTEIWKFRIPEYPRWTETGRLENARTTANCVRQTKDGGYLAVGDVNYFSSKGIQDTGIIKLDVNGSEEWNRTTRGGVHQSVTSVIETENGDFIIVGNVDKYRTTGMDALIIRVDASGNELGKKTAGGDRDQHVYSVAQMIDGGLILAGSERNADYEGLSRAWLMKVGNDSISSDTITQEVTINNTGEEKSNTSMPIAKRDRSKAIPSFELIFSLFPIGILFILKRIRNRELDQQDTHEK